MQPVTQATAAKVAASAAVFDAPAMTVKAAQHIIDRGVVYELGGRGPEAFDGYGFVRHCIKVVFDARQLVLDEDPRDLPDRARAAYRTAIPPGGRTPADAVPVEPDGKDLEQVCLAAGMVMLPGRGLAVVKPGDVVLYVGVGPAGAIVLATSGDRTEDLMALAWDAPPKPSTRLDLSRHRVRVYRWPEGVS